MRLRASGVSASAIVATLAIALAGCAADEPIAQDEPAAAVSNSPGVSAEPFSYPAPTSRQQGAEIRAEWNDRVMACMRDAGYEVTPLGDGSYEINVGSESEDAFAAADRIEAACGDAVGPYPTPAPITPDEASALYDANLEAKQCLESQGVVVSEPPSRETFIEAYLGMTVAPWSPYDGVGSSYDAVCPQPQLE